MLLLEDARLIEPGQKKAKQKLNARVNREFLTSGCAHSYEFSKRGSHTGRRERQGYRF